MSYESALVHDFERTSEHWKALLKKQTDLPVLERAFRAVVVLLMTSGLRGLAGVKTSDVAELTGVNESTLFRYIDKRDQLVSDAVDWCWKKVNESIAFEHHRRVAVGSSAADLITIDVEAFLGMFNDCETRLHGTGAVLSFRRAEQLTSGSQPLHQLAFRSRLVSLCQILIDECDSGVQDPELIATYITNYISTAWLTWLSDIDSRGPTGVLSLEMIMYHVRTALDTFSSCKFAAYNSMNGKSQGQ